MPRPQPLLSFEVDTSGQDTSLKHDDFDSEFRRSWYHYLPLCLLLFLMVAPYPSLLIVLVNHYLHTLDKPIAFVIHFLVIFTLKFLAFVSLMVCVARDPGPVYFNASDQDPIDQREDMGLAEALMTMGNTDDDCSPDKFCRKCWVPKPERAHHCSICGRCVLKMDHHCPWLGAKCIGHRTYPAFVHFLTCITAFSAYVATISISAVRWSFNNPLLVPDQATPVHELLLAAAGVIFTLVVGSFLVYHIYLITTNQTTIEALSPFLLLRYIPPLPASMKLSDPPMEEELSYNQRRVVRDAHRFVRMYDVGWRRNWAQVFGWSKPRGWIYLLLIGGTGNGDGRSFPRNARSQEMLSQLAARLEKEA
ncbi:DHHC palmitoyltransferase-domain-containing protein [Suillus americanus]|nr:DHHC palmitoyltransferase-domain-containing protein [Suillus americanus]